MHSLWILSGILTRSASLSRRRLCFRLLNCLLAGLAGGLTWLLVRSFALDSLDWLICFVGYPVMFHGLLGSTVYLMRVDNDTEE